MKLSGKNFNFNFSVKTHVMGILNVTPDSFSDGGHFFNKSHAVEQALRMQADGADIIDIGGESTRPGSQPVSIRDEIARTVPVIQSLAKITNIPLSIDTCKSQVADAALRAGASIVNDISGLRFDKKMAQVIARHKAPVVIMHIKGTPQNMQNKPVYKALIPEIMDYLRESMSIAEQAGISTDRIILDPGIGFGKTVAHNLEIIRRMDEFAGFEKPLLLGPSRKSFIGKVLGDLPVRSRLEGTAAAVAAGILKGAHIIRVHDVKEMVRVVRLTDAIKNGF
jgi:dihydropteroate synthase